MKPDFKDPKFEKNLRYIAQTLDPIEKTLRYILDATFKKIRHNMDMPEFSRPAQQPIFFAPNPNNPVSPPAGYGLCNIPLEVVQNTLMGSGMVGMDRFALWMFCVDMLEALHPQRKNMERKFEHIRETLAMDMHVGMGDITPRQFDLIACSVDMDTHQRKRAMLAYYIHYIMFNMAPDDEISVRETLTFLQASYAIQPYGATHVHLYKYGPKPLPEIFIGESVRVLL